MAESVRSFLLGEGVVIHAGAVILAAYLLQVAVYAAAVLLP